MKKMIIYKTNNKAMLSNVTDTRFCLEKARKSITNTAEANYNVIHDVISV